MDNKLCRKEWLKVSDDFISNETVYIDQEFIDRSAKCGSVFIKGYMRGDFELKITCRVTCRHGYFHEYRVVLQRLPGLNAKWACGGKMADKRVTIVNPGNMEGHLMFVLIRELIQDIDNVAGTNIPSLVRIEGLQLADQVNCFCWELRQDSLVVPNPRVESSDSWFGDGRRLGHVDRKLDATLRALSHDLGQSVDDVVEDGSQFGNAAGDRTAKACGNLAENHESIAKYLIGSFRLLLGDYSVRLGVKESPASKFEVLDVAPGCIESVPHLWHVVSGPHML